MKGSPVRVRASALGILDGTGVFGVRAVTRMSTDRPGWTASCCTGAVSTADEKPDLNSQPAVDVGALVQLLAPTLTRHARDARRTSPPLLAMPPATKSLHVQLDRDLHKRYDRLIVDMRLDHDF